MTCDGCVKAVERVLFKVKGVQAVSIDLSTKTVTVSGTATWEDCVAAVQTIGKKVLD